MTDSNISDEVIATDAQIAEHYRICGISPDSAYSLSMRPVINRLQKAEKERDELKAASVNEDMASGALNAIQELLDNGGIPRGTFPDDQVRNLVALYNNQRKVLEHLKDVFETESVTVNGHYTGNLKPGVLSVIEFGLNVDK